MSCPADARVSPGPSAPPMHRLTFAPVGPPRTVALPDGGEAWLRPRPVAHRGLVHHALPGRAELPGRLRLGWD
ncbi:hypothetical protein ACWC5G_33070, partial [Streptomyces sp. NPDC001274]